MKSGFRSEKKGSFSIKKEHYLIGYDSDGNPVHSDSTETIYLSDLEVLRETWRGSNSPRVAGKLRISPTSYSKTRISRSGTFVMSRSQGSSSLTTVQTNYVAGPSGFHAGSVGSLIESLDAKVRNQLANDARAMIWHTPEFVGELHKTYTSFATAVSLASKHLDSAMDPNGALSKAERYALKYRARYFKRYRRYPPSTPITAKEVGNFIGRKSKAVAKAWLGFVFGVLPALSDIKSAAETLADFRDPPPRRVKFRRSASDTCTDPVMGPDGKPHGTVTSSVSVVKQFSVEVSSTAVRAANRLGADNPLEAMWQLTSLSWFVDYFVNISDYLNQFSAYAGLAFAGGTSSTSVKTKGYYAFSETRLTNGWTETAATTTGWEYDEYSRSVDGNFPTPVLVVNLNPLDLSRRHAMNSLALLVSSIPIRK